MRHGWKARGPPGPIPFGICICSSNRNHTTYLWRLPNTTYLPTFTLPNREVFNRLHAAGVACQQGTLTPPDTWSCPTLGLTSVLMLRPISPELVLFLDFWVSNIPRYFCFLLIRFPVELCIFILNFSLSSCSSQLGKANVNEIKYVYVHVPVVYLF